MVRIAVLGARVDSLGMSQDVLLVYMRVMYIFQVTKDIAEASFLLIGYHSVLSLAVMPGSRETEDLIYLNPCMFIRCLLPKGEIDRVPAS